MADVTLQQVLEALEKATPDCSIDRASNAPGGMECVQCGIVFVGGEEHSICGKCHAFMEAERLGMTWLRANAERLGEMERDAERYQWAKQNRWPRACPTGYYLSDGVIYPSEDAAIDAARASAGGAE